MVGKHSVLKKEEKGNKMGKVTVVLKSLLIAYIVTGLCLVCLALLLYKLRLGEQVVTIGIIVIYAVASFIAGLLAGKWSEQRKYLWGLATGSGYFIILLVVSLIFHESPKEIAANVYTAFAICAGSGMLGGMLS